MTEGEGTAGAPRRSLLPEGSPKRLALSWALVAACALAVGVISLAVPAVRLESLTGAAVAPEVEAEVGQATRSVAEDVRAEAADGLGASVDAAVAAFEDAGYDVGYVVVDLDGDWEASHADDVRCYSASSIKAPYLVSLFSAMEGRGEAPSEELMRTASQILVWSDNESYSSLRERESREEFVAWLVDAGVARETADSLAQNWYGDISARELALMWLAIADYLEAGSPGAVALGELMSRPDVSSIREHAPEGATTYSKAGWFPEAGAFGSKPSTCEGGIVAGEASSCVIAVVSNAPEDFDLLDSLVEALIALHDART